jgi:hypothetical protein
LQGVRIWFAEQSGPRSIRITTAAFERPRPDEFGVNEVGWQLAGESAQRRIWTVYLENIARNYFSSPATARHQAGAVRNAVNPLVGYVVR